MSVTSLVTSLVSSDPILASATLPPGRVLPSDQDDRLLSPKAMDDDDMDDDDDDDDDDARAVGLPVVV